MAKALRNIAIIAHVDHGKTTLVDQLLRQSGVFRNNQNVTKRVMDSNVLEKERGITILSKNCSVEYNDTYVNIIDTPGHADFGGEVERVLSMVEGVLLLVDAVEGPMPQTVFVTRKALSLGLKPIVVVNKIDKPGARPDFVINEVFELFDRLGATEEQLDFPVVYASGLSGYSSSDPDVRSGDMSYLFEIISKYVPKPQNDSDGPFQMQIASLDYNSYVGKIGIGKIHRGVLYPSMDVALKMGESGPVLKSRINQVLKFSGLDRVSVEKAEAGDIVLINGIEDVEIGITIADPLNIDALPVLKIDEPTLTMNFMVNTSPLAGKEGKFVTSRQIRDRLDLELKSNVALKVRETDDDTVFEVSGRGELHLTILLETMRREGYELSVSRPRVVYKDIDGVKHEPFEDLTLYVDDVYQGAVMEEVGRRKGDLQNMIPDNHGRTRLEYVIPARSLIGFQNDFMSITRGSGLMSHVFREYAPFYEGSLSNRRNGVLISQYAGESVAYALWKLQDRGRMFIKPGESLYEGMIIGVHSRDNDLVVNPVREKQLTNVRASGTDEAIRLVPPINLTLEYAIEFIEDDELVEITPKSIRLRKRYLQEHERRRNRNA
ncbi:translational GTPase TypA [Candidatus Kinetoplastidibacterium crithidiae]|uniref:Large ribosomal subunit assembly factor BipA n=1 Tax=Candidatus Kinetoplastidibacterium crithidiae TCC036E TaxID=1208918 RepID=M1L4T8_9PROT|nr:translational GTPase TypA [Candidatus Kinetoplastibacterium crithidii]AFZ82646.1 GTP-binding protein [Candidatus Kinetoplastibacterium crithidii (ex Angomonas deanei ATCC 30255)]AGF47693.1 GTP-binding protein [Candidatus Kinetoplastibacterium crithidii TCC036E]EPY26947.1 GTP-binding protein [Angomonas deanei]|eukprot:EPY26947.1 GTP-binding protein [Angomonas deanei]